MKMTSPWSGQTLGPRSQCRIHSDRVAGREHVEVGGADRVDDAGADAIERQHGAVEAARAAREDSLEVGAARLAQLGVDGGVCVVHDQRRLERRHMLLVELSRIVQSAANHDCQRGLPCGRTIRMTARRRRA